MNAIPNLTYSERNLIQGALALFGYGDDAECLTEVIWCLEEGMSCLDDDDAIEAETLIVKLKGAA